MILGGTYAGSIVIWDTRAQVRVQNPPGGQKHCLALSLLSLSSGRGRQCEEAGDVSLVVATRTGGLSWVGMEEEETKEGERERQGFQGRWRMTRLLKNRRMLQLSGKRFCALGRVNLVSMPLIAPSLVVSTYARVCLSSVPPIFDCMQRLKDAKGTFLSLCPL